MTRWRFAAAALALAVGVLTAAPAGAWKRGDVDVLAVLPDVTHGVKSSVEGLTVGPDGNIYVPSFGFNTQGAISGPAVLFVISPDGNVIRKVTIANSSPHMLGLRFNPATGALWVLDFGAGNVLNVDPRNGNSSVVAGPIPGSGLNALTFDRAGNGYVSDSFNGTIWKIPTHGGSFAVWKSDPLLQPGTGLTPPFGANGVEFSNDGSKLFVTNTAFHQLIQIAVNGDGSAGAASIFITGINAPDGIAIDKHDNIWVCANQEDEIVVVDKTGKVIAKLGDFGGIDRDGAPVGFLWSNSLVFRGDDVLVTNLSLDAGAYTSPSTRTIDGPWAERVKLHTVSKIKKRIPGVPD